MSDSEAEERAQLQARLAEIERDFEHEMRARGFDPAQDENVALTAPLAKLYAERQRIQEKLETLEVSDTEENL